MAWPALGNLSRAEGLHLGGIVRQQFASDNNAGVCPEALEALVEENGRGHQAGYGEDATTQAAVKAVQEVFETDCAVHFVFNGTAANALLLAQLCRSYHGVITHAFSHIQQDEAGAVSFYSGGANLMTAEGPGAKLPVDAIHELARYGHGVHHVKARAISLTQSTELGTVYDGDEIRALTAAARKYDLKVHMDGARFANAIVSQDVSPAELSWRAGVDALSFGGVKNGLAVGECVVIFDTALGDEFEWRVKQAGHLNSKMRLVTGPWRRYIEDGVWLKNARHANAMAQRLGCGLQAIGDVELMYPVQANAVFAYLPEPLQAGLRDKGWQFYTFVPPTGCRLVCAWDTVPATIDQFLEDARAVVAAGAGSS